MGSSNIKRITSDKDDFGSFTQEKQRKPGLVPQQLETLQSNQSNGIVLPSFCLNQRGATQQNGTLNGSFNQFSSMRLPNQMNGGGNNNNKDSNQKSNSIIPQEQLQMIQDLDQQLKRM
jgi:hypothetical protein